MKKKRRKPKKSQHLQGKEVLPLTDPRVPKIEKVKDQDIQGPDQEIETEQEIEIEAEIGIKKEIEIEKETEIEIDIRKEIEIEKEIGIKKEEEIETEIGTKKEIGTQKTHTEERISTEVKTERDIHKADQGHLHGIDHPKVHEISMLHHSFSQTANMDDTILMATMTMQVVYLECVICSGHHLW